MIVTELQVTAAPDNKSVCKVFEPSPETDPGIEGAATQRYE